MPNRVVVGAQWGDEGKGKVVDLLSEEADLVVRFAGGNNAGHTLEVEGRRLVLHLVPSGVLHAGKQVLLGDGMVVDPAGLLAEMDALAGAGVALPPEVLRLSVRAHLVLPYHRALDELREGGAGALGTTRRGIGPAYEDKAARRGIRAGDLLHPDRLRRRVAAALEEANLRLRARGGRPLELAPILDELAAQAGRLAPHLEETSLAIARALEAGRSLLFEGAQGALLDLDHGTYPFVTSSTTVGSGAPLATRRVDAIIGVSKAYTTRVGEGPFPTELHGDEAEALRRRGSEYGATTGRPRRCGWLDLPALRYAARVSGLTALALTKLDILAGLPRIPVCEGYTLDGARLPDGVFPADGEDLARVQPIYRELAGFEGELAGVRAIDDLPAAVKSYLALIEREVGLPIALVSTGPGRHQTLLRKELLG
ncbi:MAG: adenylosuccinate synthase [Acidobacteriota bacterium]